MAHRTREVPVEGTCRPGFEGVRSAFVDNFANHGELGASLCVVVRGEVAVDLGGGWSDAACTVPWRRDALVNFFSVGKAFAALCLARLVAGGSIGVEDPVCRHWPEFGAAGKEAVSVADLLSHRAGLPAVRRRLPPGAMFDHGSMCAELADQAPWWPPGTAHGYHTNTFGFLVAELFRRVDGRSLGTALREDLAGPLGADVHIGIPEALHPRVSEFFWPGYAPAEAEPAGLGDAELMEYNAYFNPSGLSGAGCVNTAAWRSAEIPSTNGHGTARGVARLYEALAAGGVLGGVDVLDAATIAAFSAERSSGTDLVLHRPSRFGLGFQLTQPERPLGPGAGSFGHFGAGGSLGFCDPGAGVAFGYVINTMGPRWQNPRNRALIDALYGCLAERS